MEVFIWYRSREPRQENYKDYVEIKRFVGILIGNGPYIDQ